MPRAALAAALLIPVVLTAACGNGDSPSAAAAVSTSGSSAQTPAPTPTPAATTPSPLEGKSALQVWQQSLKAAHAAQSVHVVGTVKDGKDKYAVDLRMGNQKAIGTLSVNGSEMTIRRLGPTLYFKADESFWHKEAGASASAAAGLADKWVKSTVKDKDSDDFSSFTDVDSFVDDAFRLTKAEHKDLKLVKGKTVQGQSTVGIYDSAASSTDDDDEPGTLYVADSGPSLPLQVVGDTKTSHLSLTDWNDDVSVEAPTDAVSA